MVGIGLLLIFSSLLAQATEMKKPAVEVELLPVLAEPGTAVSIPLILKNRSKDDIGRFVGRIKFPQILSFVKTDEGLGGELAGAELKTETKKDEDPNYRILEITLTAKKLVTDLILANLIFDLDENVEMGTTLEVQTIEARAWTSANVEIQPVSGAVGVVTVVQRVVIPACFFYMH